MALSCAGHVIGALMNTSGEIKPQPKKWIVPVVLLTCGAFLYLQAFMLPDVPRIANGDQGIHLSLAARMFDGQLIYRDYDHFPLPGTDVFYLMLFKLFGVRAWIAPAMLVVLGVGLAWLSIEISRKLMPGPIVFLPGFLFLTLPFSGFFDATHHWYSALAGTAALAVVIEKRTLSRLAWAGVLWGLAAWFSQSVVLGALALGLFLAWEQHRTREPRNLLLRKEGCLFAGLLGTLTVFNAYFVWKVGFRRFLNYTVVFLFKYYPADSFNKWSIYMADRPSIRAWSQWPNLAAFLLIHFIVPLVYILFFVRYWRESRLHPEEPWDRLMLLNLTGLFLFLSIVHSIGYMRLFTGSLPALILAVWFLKASLKPERILRQALWATVLVVAIARPAITQTLWNASLDLPTGRTAFAGFPVLYDKFKWVSARTRPGDYFFDDPQLCFGLRLRDPSRVPFLRPTGYTRPEEVQDAVQALEQHQVRFVHWFLSLDNEIVDPADDNLGPLRVYLRDHYHVAITFSNLDQIWERNK
jgi:hypothetical protein